MQQLAIIGIDPGTTGAIAFMSLTKSMKVDLVTARMLPVDVGDFERTIIDAARFHDMICKAERLTDTQIVLAMVELVHSTPKWGMKQLFSFGATYGRIRAALDILHVKTKTVKPKDWKSRVLNNTGRDKTAAIAFCQKHFPKVRLAKSKRSVKPQDGIADALCICEYGRLLLKGG